MWVRLRRIALSSVRMKIRLLVAAGVVCSGLALGVAPAALADSDTGGCPDGLTLDMFDLQCIPDGIVPAPGSVTP